MGHLQSLEFNEFRAFVEVDGKPLDCHAVALDRKKKQVSGWIASEEGKNFSIHLKKPKTKCLIYVIVSLDGHEVVCEVFEHRRDKAHWDHLRTSETTQRSFKFSPLKVTEEVKSLDAIVSGSQAMQKVGLIEVVIFQAINAPQSKSSALKGRDELPLDEPSPVGIPENVVKGKILHQVEFGEETVTPRTVSQQLHDIYAQITCDFLAWQTRIESAEGGQKTPRSKAKTRKMYVANMNKQLAKFSFHFRSLDVLQRAGTIPASLIPPRETAAAVSGPSSGPSEDHLQSNSKKRKASEPEPNAEADVKPDVKLREYEESEKNLLAALEKLRGERAAHEEAMTSGNDARKRVKLEEPQRSFFVPGEVIDLTQDY